MSTNENSEPRRTRTMSPQVVAAIMGIVAFIGPIAIQFSSYGYNLNFSILAWTWVYYSDPWGPNGNFMIDPMMLFTALVLGTLRPVFAYMMYRLYNEKTTKKRTLIVGIAAELQTEVVMYITVLPMVLFNPYPEMYVYLPLVFPIPILILVGLAIIKIYPPPVNESWVETEQIAHWWEKTDEKTEDTEVTEDTAPMAEHVEDVTTKSEDDGWLKDN